jgi:hypothetical protein
MTNLQAKTDGFEVAMRNAFGWTDHYFMRRDSEYALTLTRGAWLGWITAIRASSRIAGQEKKENP